MLLTGLSMFVVVAGVASVVDAAADGGFNGFQDASFFNTKFSSGGSRYPTAKPSTYESPTSVPVYSQPAQTYSNPAPAQTYSNPAPVQTYSNPAPVQTYSNPAPVQTYSNPAPYPSYKQPTHNCTVQDEKVLAEVCTPSFVSKCEPVSLKGTQIASKPKCLQISRTVCAQTTEETTVTLCSIKYNQKADTTEATTIDISFEKECSKQMVTVCKPQYGQESYGYSKGSYQHCKEIAQETCFNKPTVTPKKTQVDVRVPEPTQDCQPMRVELPTVECENVEEERCVDLPALEGADVSAEQCTVEIGPPECKPVELVLPKQVCQEVLYGHASKPKVSSGGYSSH